MSVESVPPARDPMLGRVIAEKYRIDAFLGAGAMGRVYRATQRPIDKVVAVKVLNANLLDDPATQQRFLREAQAASRIDHPNSVAVFDFGHLPDGTAFIVMEYLRGESLDDLLQREGALSAPRCVAILSQVLAALSEAHESGIVHRDLKPENIMLVARTGDDGREGFAVKVTDFGIAKLLDGDPDAVKLTATGIIPGSPAYMSPEQARGRVVDGRSDLYQCGVILHEMITGELPFAGESAIEVIMRHIKDPAPAARTRNPDCPSALEAIILRALEKEPAMRFADARAMRHALRSVAPDQVTATAPLARSVRPLPDIRPSVELTPPHAAPRAPSIAPARPRPVRSRRSVVVSSVVVAASVALAGALIALHPARSGGAATSTARASSGHHAPALRRGRGSASPTLRVEAAAMTTALMVPPRVEAPAVEAIVAEAPAVETRRSSRARRAAAASPVEPAVVEAPTPAVLEAPAPAVLEAPTPAVVEAPAVVAAPAVAAHVVVAPTPSVVGVEGSLLAVQVTGGLTRSAFQGRATTAVDALARCLTRGVERGDQAGTLAGSATVSATIAVRDRRVDEVQLTGAPGLGACHAAVRGAFYGDLPQAEDTDYEVRLSMRLSPRR